MKAVVLTENGIELQELESGALSREWVRIRVAQVGLCGSDVAKISAPSLPAWHTRILGHEFCGQIAELGGQAEYVSIGDHVVAMPLLSCGVCDACRRRQENICEQGQAIGRTTQGAFAEFVDAPLTNVFRIVKGNPLTPYVLADPLAVCIHAKNLAGTHSPRRRCLVVGDGTIGCLLGWLLHAQGHEVWIKGLHKEALRFIEEFGVNVTEKVQTRHFDVVFEAVGRSQQHSLDDSLKAVRWGGIVVVLGVFSHGYEYPLIARDLFIGEVRVVGANAYLRSEFEEAVKMIEERGKELRAFISHRFHLFQFEDALAVAENKQGLTMKIVLETESVSP